jgi:hypothetical protein
LYYLKNRVTLIGGVGIPIVAHGGTKTRNLTGVDGNLERKLSLILQ